MGRLLRLAIFAVVVFIVLVVLIAVFARGRPAASPLPGRPAALEAEERAGIVRLAQSAAARGLE